eukprot:TRINITY_DN3982_c0_g4_i1.p1 TRINITY_DN3982_c0_g4~~TRINITY_DN3982_c0_g4_i1.p1  ORF type:complete len:1141 (+),score=516.72 TRINITY_DN3982_c0_g4_i1:21-3443(+)
MGNEISGEEQQDGDESIENVKDVEEIDENDAENGKNEGKSLALNKNWSSGLSGLLPSGGIGHKQLVSAWGSLTQDDSVVENEKISSDLSKDEEKSQENEEDQGEISLHSPPQIASVDSAGEIGEESEGKEENDASQLWKSYLEGFNSSLTKIVDQSSHSISKHSSILSSIPNSLSSPSISTKIQQLSSPASSFLSSLQQSSQQFSSSSLNQSEGKERGEEERSEQKEAEKNSEIVIEIDENLGRDPNESNAQLYSTSWEELKEEEEDLILNRMKDQSSSPDSVPLYAVHSSPLHLEDLTLNSEPKTLLPLSLSDLTVNNQLNDTKSSEKVEIPQPLSHTIQIHEDEGKEVDSHSSLNEKLTELNENLIKTEDKSEKVVDKVEEAAARIIVEAEISEEDIEFIKDTIEKVQIGIAEKQIDNAFQAISLLYQKFNEKNPSWKRQKQGEKSQMDQMMEVYVEILDSLNKKLNQHLLPEVTLIQNQIQKESQQSNANVHMTRDKKKNSEKELYAKIERNIVYFSTLKDEELESQNMKEEERGKRGFEKYMMEYIEYRMRMEKNRVMESLSNYLFYKKKMEEKKIKRKILSKEEFHRKQMEKKNTPPNQIKAKETQRIGNSLSYKKESATVYQDQDQYIVEEEDEEEEVEEEENEVIERDELDFGGAVRALFECGAVLIEKKIPFIQLHFGTRWTKEAVERILNSTDKLTNPIFETFMEHTQLLEIIKKVNESRFLSEQEAVSLDPRDLSTLLDQMSFISQCSSFFDDFLKRKLKQLEGNEWNSSSLINKQFQRQAYVKEIMIYYSILEEYFMMESSKRAIGMDTSFSYSAEDGSEKTTSVVDNVFFVLKQCGHRALCTANVNACCSIISMISNILTIEYKTVLERLLFDAIEGEDAFRPLILLNNVEISSQFISVLKKELETEATRIYSNPEAPQEKKKDLEKIETVLTDLSHVSQEFKNELLMKYLKKASQRLYSQIQLPEMYMRYNIDEQTFQSNEVNDPWVWNFLTEISEVLKPYKNAFTQTNYGYLIQLVLEEMSKDIERILNKKAFNILGSIQLHQEIKSMIEFFSKDSQKSVRNSFSRLSQISSILGLEKLEDIYELWKTPIKWKLTPNEVRAVLSKRVEFDRGDVAGVSLSSDPILQ